MKRLFNKPYPNPNKQDIMLYGICILAGFVVMYGWWLIANGYLKF